MGERGDVLVDALTIETGAYMKSGQIAAKHGERRRAVVHHRRFDSSLLRILDRGERAEYVAGPGIYRNRIAIDAEIACLPVTWRTRMSKSCAWLPSRRSGRIAINPFDAAVCAHAA